MRPGGITPVWSLSGPVLALRGPGCCHHQPVAVRGFWKSVGFPTQNHRCRGVKPTSTPAPCLHRHYCIVTHRQLRLRLCVKVFRLKREHSHRRAAHALCSRCCTVLGQRNECFPSSLAFPCIFRSVRVCKTISVCGSASSATSSICNAQRAM